MKPAHTCVLGSSSRGLSASRTVSPPSRTTSRSWPPGSQAHERRSMMGTSLNQGVRATPTKTRNCQSSWLSCAAQPCHPQTQPSTALTHLAGQIRLWLGLRNGARC